jgi:transposase
VAGREGEALSTIAQTVQCSLPTVRLWIGRFNGQGLAGFQDCPRSGRPPRYSAEQVGQLIEFALTDPDTLDLPFACWTLDRLQYYANEVLEIPIKRARIREPLLAEGLRSRSQETWFAGRRRAAAASVGHRERPAAAGHDRPAILQIGFVDRRAGRPGSFCQRLDDR